jgi:signal transduction histidine kinase
MKALVLEMLSTEAPECRQLGITIAQDFLAGALWLSADPKKLKQVFLNIFKNAVEAMPAGGTLSISNGQDARQAWIDIADTGIGVAEDLDVFEAFTTTKAQGTGLGLSIVKKIMTAHGGNVTYTSTPGKGSVFRVIFPLD